MDDANTTTTGLSGMDFLKRHNATLTCSTGVLTLGGSTVECRDGPSVMGGRAVVREPICVAPRHVALVTVGLEIWGGPCPDTLLIESIPAVCQNIRSLLPRCLVDATTGTAKVWVTNMSEKEVSLEEIQLMAQLTEAQISEPESESEAVTVSTVSPVKSCNPRSSQLICKLW